MARQCHGGEHKNKQVNESTSFPGAHSHALKAQLCSFNDGRGARALSERPSVGQRKGAVGLMVLICCL